MGWNQFFRSVAAANRRAHRDAVRRQREHIRQMNASARAMEHASREAARAAKRAAKEHAHQQAMDEASQFEAYVEALTTLHTDYGDAWDWHAVSTTAPPLQPSPRSVAETAARAELDAYRPGLIDRVSGEATRRRAELENTLQRAIAFDRQQNDAALTAYRADHLVWQTETHLAPGVLRFEHRACEEALRHAAAFEDIERFGSKVQLVGVKPDVATMSCLIEDDEIVPREEVKASQAGRVSRKTLAAGKYAELYRTHVCSCALRVAMETLAVIPIRRVIVNVSARGTDSSTGHLVNSTLLAVHFIRDGLERLNLERVDPCAALEHFPHRMKFKKTQGLLEVEPMSDDEQWVTT